MLKKTFFAVYALCAYIAGIASLTYIVGFFAGIGVPKDITDGAPVALKTAVVTDAGLVLLFGLHHSLTARASFKRWWTKIIPAPIERATYLYMTTAMTALLVICWRPIPIEIWNVENAVFAGAIRAAYLAVWAMMVAATFHFGHFGFFGLTQVWERIREKRAQPSSMSARYLYALVRHPISLGWMLAPWLTPHLTLGHAVFALATFVYIMAATPFEEGDLIGELGDDYRDYRKRTPAFIPGLKRKQRHRQSARVAPGA